MSRIELNNLLTSYFHPDEIEVILSEIFYLPFFLRQSDISRVRDIINYGLMEASTVIDRLQLIHDTKPFFEETAGYSQVIDLNDLLRNKTDLASQLLQFKNSQKPYCLIAASRQQGFSAAMYLIEEGVKISKYSVI